eukprot:493986-Amphidinium_carterae.2
MRGSTCTEALLPYAPLIHLLGGRARIAFIALEMSSPLHDVLVWLSCYLFGGPILQESRRHCEVWLQAGDHLSARDPLYSELLEAELEERRRNRKKTQAHHLDVPDAHGLEGGAPTPSYQYCTRDDNRMTPAGSRPICPDFLTDKGCSEGGLCTMPLRCGNA